MSLIWYTYNSHPHQEEFLCQQIEAIKLDYYFPSLHVKPVNPRSRKIRPYFPGYLFIKADLDIIGLNTLQFLPYSKGLVQFGGEPAGVPDELITAIRKRVDLINSDDYKRAKEEFAHGQAVAVVGGILDGFEGLFDENLSGTERSRILIKTINHHAIRVEISNLQLKHQNDQGVK